MIKLSLKGFAKYMVANSAQQRKILRDYKYPDPEGKAQITYYREARDYIKAYHQNGHDKKWLIDRHSSLASNAAAASGGTKTRLQNNARAVRQYARHFAGRQFEILPDISLSLIFPEVQVTVFPDLHVIERKKEKIIKLEFAKNAPDPRLIKIMSQALFEAQSEAGMGLTSASVLVLDVSRGEEHRGARVGSRLGTEIEAACENIAAIWDGI